MRNFHRDFDKDFNLIRRVVIAIMILSFMTLIVSTGLIGYVAFNVVKDPSVIGETAGDIYKKFKDHSQ